MLLRQNKSYYIARGRDMARGQRSSDTSIERARVNAQHREQCYTFDSEQEFITWRLFNERYVESIFIV